jgi:hydroxyacylglutathione hydrolase
MNSMTSSKLQVEQLVVGPIMTNCYIVWDDQTKQGAIIDAGDEADIILSAVKKLGIEITHIFATHGHFDHVAAVAPLKRAFKAEFLAHKDDFFFIEDGENAARRWGFNIEPPPKPDRFIEDGDTIKVGGCAFKVLHTPGHSPGGISFLHNAMVFVGDTLFQSNTGRTDLRMGSFEDLKKSIKTRLYNLPDDTIVYTGHGPNTTIGSEKRHNPFVRP